MFHTLAHNETWKLNSIPLHSVLLLLLLLLLFHFQFGSPFSFIHSILDISLFNIFNQYSDDVFHSLFSHSVKVERLYWIRVQSRRKFSNKRIFICLLSLRRHHWSPLPIFASSPSDGLSPLSHSPLSLRHYSFFNSHFCDKQTGWEVCDVSKSDGSPSSGECFRLLDASERKRDFPHEFHRANNTANETSR